MKTFTKLIAAALVLCAPALLRANSDMDRKIEATAKASYNYRTVLENHVDVSAHDGVVTLTGSVPDADQKRLAEDTVRNLPGVTSVDNRIQIASAAPERSDAWIAAKIKTQLLLKGNVSAVNTKVDVKDGVVTLTGNADSMAQKELTTAYVKDVEGVKDVKNELTVADAPAASPSLSDRIDDASITAQVKYALLTHKSTSALKTSVTTNDGTVVIEGEAASDAERDLVTHIAKGVHGVKEVTNNMQVKD
ncbi:MAG TPA: BON domain-containing protein [Lacunisphaera sp.]|nr:BON domain-containing protein [Lacunisphaera sp.]